MLRRYLIASIFMLSMFAQPVFATEVTTATAISSEPTPFFDAENFEPPVFDADAVPKKSIKEINKNAGPNLNISVPIQMPVYIGDDGQSINSTSINIKNNSENAIIVSSFQVRPLNDWVLQNYDYAFHKDAIDTKNFGFQINKIPVTTTGILDTNPFIIDGFSIFNVNYELKTSARLTDINYESIADVVFIVDWLEPPVIEEPDIPENELDEVPPEVEPEPVAPEVKPEVEPEPVAPEVKPEVEPEPVAPEVTPEVEPEPVAPEVPPEVEPEPVAPEVTPEVEPEPVAPEVPPEVEPEPVAPDVTPEVEPEPVAPEVPPEVEPEPVAPEVPPEVEPEPVAPDVTPEVEPEPVAPEVTPEVEPEPVAPDVTPEVEPEPVVPDVTPEVEPEPESFAIRDGETFMSGTPDNHSESNPIDFLKEDIF